MTAKQDEMLEEIHKDVHRLDKDNAKLNSDMKHLVETVQSLAEITGTNNRKMEDIATLISSNTLLMEKYSNLDINLKESFTRVHKRLDKVENREDTIAVNYENYGNSLARITEQIKVANNRISDLEHKHDRDREIMEVTVETLNKNGEGRLTKGLTIAFSAMTFIFGYLYLDVRSIQAETKQSLVLISDLEKTLVAHIAADDVRIRSHIAKEMK